MVTDSAPVWLQQLLAAAIFIGTTVGAVIAGRKSKGEPSSSQATLLAGTITDSKQVDKIVDALDSLKSVLRELNDRRHADSRDERERMEDHRDSLEANTRALKDNTDAMRAQAISPEMLALLARMK